MDGVWNEFVVLLLTNVSAQFCLIRPSVLSVSHWSLSATRCIHSVVPMRYVVVVLSSSSNSSK
jgi:hypothetical protein